MEQLKCADITEDKKDYINQTQVASSLKLWLI